MKKASWILAAVGMAAFVSQTVAQEKAPAPMPAPKGTVIVQPAPAHGYATPSYNYQPECCDHGGRKGGWTAGVEATILKPHFSNGVIIAGPSAVEDEDDNDVLINLPSAKYTEANFDVGFRVWAACLNCDGMGARVRYWRWASEDSATFVPVGEETENDGDLDPRTNTDELNIDSLDLEVMGQFDMGGGTLSGAAGLRVARVEFLRTFQKGPSNGTGDDPPGIIDISTSESDFWGFGPTLAIEFSYPLGSCRAFVTSRASLLFGQTDLTLITGVTNDAGASPPETREGQNDASMVYVVEIAIGAEYTCCLGDCEMFVRGAFEAQWWANSLHHSLLKGDELTGDDDRTFFRARADDSVGFVGLTLGAGIKY